MKTFLKVCAILIATSFQISWISRGFGMAGIIAVGFWSAIEITIIVNLVKRLKNREP